jgi:hypothetical protein
VNQENQSIVDGEEPRRRLSLLRRGVEELFGGRRRPEDLLELPSKREDPLLHIQSWIELTLDLCVPVLDEDNPPEIAYHGYLAVARMILGFYERDEFLQPVMRTLRRATKHAARQRDPEDQAWTMQGAFEDVLEERLKDADD